MDDWKILVGILLIFGCVLGIGFAIDHFTAPDYDEHLATANKFHEAMHEAGMSHSHPMPVRPKPKGQGIGMGLVQISRRQ